MKTAMQELKEDLQMSIKTGSVALQDINDIDTRDLCINVLKTTINAIIKRIDKKLLEKEKQQIIEAFNQGQKTVITEPNQYYKNTYKQ